MFQNAQLFILPPLPHIEMTQSETYISVLNSNFFFKEFTFSKNKFKANSKEELELADNVVWLDEIFLVIQIKEQNTQSKNDPNKWYRNKVLNKAVDQIKKTLSYLNTYEKIPIQNERGRMLNVGQAKKTTPIKIVIYRPNQGITEQNRFLKFYESSQIGLIHLFHVEDYLWICKYLITPFEINEYLRFRETIFKHHVHELNKLPEQYVLGHYIETNEDFKIDFRYIENLSKIEKDIDKFDISHIIKNFQQKILYRTGENHYYYIIEELAKLNRADLRGFRMRFDLAFKKAKEQKFDIPYRMTSLNSKCGFVFIPLEFKIKDKWKNALNNFSLLHKYEQQLDKVVGMICYYNPEKEYFDVYWSYQNFVWEFDKELDRIIQEDFPLRSVKKEKTYRYYIKD